MTEQTYTSGYTDYIYKSVIHFCFHLHLYTLTA